MKRALKRLDTRKKSHQNLGKDKQRMTSNHESYLLSTNDQKDMDEWVRAIHRIILSPFGGGIFGQKLEETLRHDKRLEERSTNAVSERVVPIIIENCVNFIRKTNGITEVGLFRLPGNAMEVKALQEAYDRGDRPTFDSTTDVHTVASLLKLYLRQLPEPVIPFSQYDELINAAKLAIHANEKEENECELAMEEVTHKIFAQIELLPPAHYNLLRYLARFLYEVGQSASLNLMDVANLSLVIGPNCIRTKENHGYTMMNNNGHVQYIMEQVISGHRKYFPGGSLPDVATRTNNQVVTTQQDDTKSSSRDPGIGTLNSTASPLNTLDQNHVVRQYPQAAEDSGTGSLGPTPDNTYRPPVTSSSFGSGSSSSAPRVKPPAKPPRRKPTVPPPAPHNTGGTSASHEHQTQADQRRSVYDNINHTTRVITTVASTDDTKSVSSFSTLSSNVNQVNVQSSIDSGDKTSIKAYRGSSSEHESLLTDFCEQVNSTRQSDETIGDVTDDESNTESIAGDGTSHSVSSIADHNTVSSLHLGSYSSLKSLVKSPLSQASVSVDSPIPGPSGLCERHFKNDASDLASKIESDPPLTNITSLNHEARVVSSSTPSKPHSISTDASRKPTYQELEQLVGFLKTEVRRMNVEQEKRSRMIEDHLLEKIRSKGSNFSAPYTSSNTAFTYPNADVRSGNSSVGGYDSVAEHNNSSVFTADMSAISQQPASPTSPPNYYEKKYLEEARRHRMTKIQLRNAKRGLEQEQERNRTLQKEMEEFYNTFTNLTSDDVVTKTSNT